MAQTGFTPISNYYSATAAAVPTAGNLVAGELAINTADGKLFYKDSSGVVQTIASKAGNINVSSFSGGTTGLTPSTATTGIVTLAGTLASANGGTGVNNGSSTITVAGNLNHAGAFTQTFTATGNTSLTLPTSGTLISSVNAPTANPVTGTPSSSNYLRGDGTWATVSSGAMALLNTTSFTTASSVTVDSVFSSTYTNYLIIVNETAISGNFDTTMQFRTGGSTNSTSNYNYYGAFWDGSTNTVSGTSGSSMNVGNSISRPNTYYIWVSQPFQSVNTQIESKSAGGGRYRISGGDFATTTSFDGFILTCSSNNHTGSLKVYGLS
jgi:hypothetical protein